MPGLPKKYAKMGFKKGWREFRKSKRKRSKPKAKPKPKRRSSPKRKVSSVTKRRSFLNTQTVMRLARVAALVGPAAGIALGTGSARAKIRDALIAYTGYNIDNGSFNLARLGQGWLPFISTSLATVGISKLSGIIRRL